MCLFNIRQSGSWLEFSFALKGQGNNIFGGVIMKLTFTVFYCLLFNVVHVAVCELCLVVYLFV